MSVLIKPIISEKAGKLGFAGKYVFQVTLAANGPEIKKEVEKLYKVKVAAINTITTPGKTRRTGKNVRQTPKIKKAIVTLVPGQTIESATEAA